MLSLVLVFYTVVGESLVVLLGPLTPKVVDIRIYWTGRFGLARQPSASAAEGVHRDRCNLLSKIDLYGKNLVQSRTDQLEKQQ